MGGHGSGRPPSTETIIKRMTEQRVPLANSIFLPNLSGVKKESQTSSLGEVKVSVVHGSTAGTTRPITNSSVEWIGSIEPTNANDNDTWIDTT